MLFGRENQQKNPRRFSEEEIQKEIRNRILKESGKQEGKENAQEATQATLDALEDIVSLSREKMEKIAEQVRAEFKEKEKEESPARSVSNHRLFPWGVIILFIVTFYLIRRGSSWYLFAGLILMYVILNRFLRKPSDKDDDDNHRS